MIDKYDIEYMGVKCTGVDWTRHIFYLTKDGNKYTYMQTKAVYCNADTDHIRCVIEEQFLPWWKDERIKELEEENAKLKDKWDNLRCVYSYDGEVMEYCVNGPCPNDRRVSEVREENAELKARLEKAVELPRIIHPNPNEWHIQYQYKSGLITYDIRYSEVEAESRLAELKGEK